MFTSVPYQITATNIFAQFACTFMHAFYACIHWSAETLNINVPICFPKHNAKFHENLMSNGWEISFYMENGWVWFGLVWFGLVLCGLDHSAVSSEVVCKIWLQSVEKWLRYNTKRSPLLVTKWVPDIYFFIWFCSPLRRFYIAYISNLRSIG